MPYTLKSNRAKFRNANGEYKEFDLISENSTAEQIAAIEAKGAQTRASIPADYTALSDSVDDLKSALCNYSQFIDNSFVDPFMFTQGMYYNAEQPTISDDYYYTDLFEIESSDNLYLLKDAGGCFINYYDSNRTYISNDTIINRTYTLAPQNAVFARMSVDKTHVSTVRMYPNIYPNGGQYIAYGFEAYNGNSGIGALQKISKYERFAGNYQDKLADLDDAEDNAIYVLQPTAETVLPNLPENLQKNGTLYFLYTYKCLAFDSIYQTIHLIKGVNNNGTWLRTRLTSEEWSDWTYFPNRTGSDLIIHIGTGQQYTTLREGFAAAPEGATVYIHPGTYDLTQEFSDVISNHSGKVLALGGNRHYIFEAGSYVKALFDNTDRWVYDNFEPFYVNGDFVLEGLNIEASNTRYCVHDELEGTGTQIHKYINCVMKYTNTHSDITYVQCIGGGLGEHCTIVIDGGSYQSVTSHGSPAINNGDPAYFQTPITYHNGANANADSTIVIKNVLLVDRGFIRLGSYGPSTTKSKVYISNCSMALPPLIMRENTEYDVVNFELVELLNEKRIDGHWNIDNVNRVYTFVNGN